MQPHTCIRCARPLSITGICGQCQQHPPPYDRTTALWNYAAPVDALIQAMKFHERLDLARLLGQLLAQVIAGQLTTNKHRPDVIIPVPLHVSRLRERGFNQALEIARPVARQLGMPLDIRSCIRQLPTATQSLLPAGQRRRNMRNAFRTTRPLNGSHVAIIDDVMTTGATVRELADTLRAAGATQVSVWVLARVNSGSCS